MNGTGPSAPPGACRPSADIAATGAEDCIVQIKEAVSRAWGNSSLDLDSRRKSDALARQVAMYLARVVAGIPLKRVGEAFERDPATVLFGCKRIARMIESDTELALKIASLEPEFRTPARHRSAGHPATAAKAAKAAAEFAPVLLPPATPQQVLSECRARGEQRIASGRTKAGSLVHLLVSPDGNWTVVETRPPSARVILSGACWSETETRAARAEPATRVCLKCGRRFPSSGAGNRLCPRCLRASRANTSSFA